MATLTELKTELTNLKAARDAVLAGGQSLTQAGGKGITRVDYATLSRDIKDLERRIAVMENGGILAGKSVVFGGHRG